jgi:hypothetical protein
MLFREIWNNFSFITITFFPVTFCMNRSSGHLPSRLGFDFNPIFEFLVNYTLWCSFLVSLQLSHVCASVISFPGTSECPVNHSILTKFLCPILFTTSQHSVTERDLIDLDSQLVPFKNIDDGFEHFYNKVCELFVCLQNIFNEKIIFFTWISKQPQPFF